MEIVHEEQISRPPELYSEIIEGQNIDCYIKLWGLFYKYTYQHYTYDLKNKTIINCKTFDTQSEFQRFKEKPEDFKWYCKYDYDAE